MSSRNSLPQNNSEHSQATSTNEKLPQATSTNEKLTQATSTNEKLELTQATSTNEKLKLTQATSNAPSSSVSSNTTITSASQKKLRAELMTDKEKKNREEMTRRALDFVLFPPWNADPAEAPPLPEWDEDLDGVPSSHVSSNTVIMSDSQEEQNDSQQEQSDSQEEQKAELTEEKEKLHVKFPFAFISQENIPNFSVIVQNENSITFTLNSKAISTSESDPAQLPPSVILENLDSTISHQDLALLPTKILPPLLGWESIPCETLKLHNLHINQELFETIQTCNVKRLHISNCTVAKHISLALGNMDALEELDVSLPNFDDEIYIPPSLEILKVHCPKSTVDFSNELVKYIRLGVSGWHSKHLKQV